MYQYSDLSTIERLALNRARFAALETEHYRISLALEHRDDIGFKLDPSLSEAHLTILEESLNTLRTEVEALEEQQQAAVSKPAT